MAQFMAEAPLGSAALLGRLSAALARRRPVGPDVEAELAALAAAEERAGRVLSGPGPTRPGPGPG